MFGERCVKSEKLSGGYSGHLVLGKGLWNFDKISDLVLKGVLIDFNYVLDRFWGDIRTQDTWLPLKWSSENFLTVSEKILKILLLHGNIVDGVGTFLELISHRGLMVVYVRLNSNIDKMSGNKTIHRFFPN